MTRSGTTTAYRYNDGGWRITKQVGTGETDVYIQDGPLTLGLFTLNASGSVTASVWNVVAGDKVVGRQPSVGARRYYHTDLLGSTRAVVEGSTVVESYDYDPMGLLMPGRTLGSGTKEGFTSKECDTETGLDYFGARSYMAAVGRWTSVDPMADAFPEWNPYTYVQGNPNSLIDPNGRMPCEDGETAAACVARLWEQAQQLGDAVARFTESPLEPGERFSKEPLIGVPPDVVTGPIARISKGLNRLRGFISAVRGSLRERRVAQSLGGVVSRRKVTVPGVGSTDVDVIGPAGEFIAVGGPAKALDLADLGHRLSIMKKAAAAEGRSALAVFTRGTPQEAIDIAIRHLGKDNVIIH